LEFGPIERSINCTTCGGNLQEVPGATALMVCNKCNRHMLKKNSTQNIRTSIVLKNGKYIHILFISDESLTEKKFPFRNSKNYSICQQ